jgi:hypothetical protein
MIDAFPIIRLARAAQAPIEAIVPFVYYLECRYRVRLDISETLKAVLVTYRDRFAPMSMRSSQLGFYQLRRVK